MLNYDLAEGVDILKRALPPEPAKLDDPTKMAADALVLAVFEAARRAGFHTEVESLMSGGRRFIMRPREQATRIYLMPDTTCGIVLDVPNASGGPGTRHAAEQPVPALRYERAEGRFVGGTPDDSREAVAVVAECIERLLLAVAAPK